MIKATTGTDGRQLVRGMDLGNLHSEKLGSGIDHKVYKVDIEWKSADLSFLLLGLRTENGAYDYRYEKLVRYILSQGKSNYTPCQYGSSEGVRCIRLLHDGRVVEARMSKGKFYDRFVDEDAL